MKRITLLWGKATDYFEHGDLVPLLVLVSAFHYASILAGKDLWFVAVAIGMLVDLGHYRTIRAAVRYSGDDKRQALARWLIAAGMTIISLAYHQRYYGDWWLSIPLPLLIAALAWLQKVDQRIGAKPSQTKAEVSQTKAEPSEVKPALPQLWICSCGYIAKSQAALNAHQRKHSPKPELQIHSNGKAH